MIIKTKDDKTYFSVWVSECNHTELTILCKKGNQLSLETIKRDNIVTPPEFKKQ